MARMIAIRPFPFAGKTRKPGDEFTVTDSRHVRILSLLGKAAIVKPEKKPEPVKKTVKKVEPVKVEPKKVEPKFEIEEEPKEEPEKEPEEPEKDEEEEPVEISPRTGLPKRRYIRRDMESEE